CLAVQSYPVANAQQIDADLEQQFELLIDTIRTIRNLRAEAGIKPSARIETILKTDSEAELQVLKATRPYIQDLAKVETLSISSTDLAPESASVAETLSVSRAAEIVREGKPTGSLEASAEDSTWKQITAVVLRFLDRPTDYLTSFFSDYKKPALSVGIILGVIMTYKVLNSILAAIDDVPGLASLFQVIGVVYLVRFGVKKGYSAEQRDRVITELKQTWAEVRGQDKSPQPVASADAAPSLSPTSPGVTPAEIIQSASKARTKSGSPQDQRKMFAGVTGTVQVLIPLTGVVDVEALRAKLEKDLGKAEGEMKSLGGRLSNQGFVSQAPAAVVQGAKDALAEAQKQAELIRERLAML
ncbi:MAG: CAAD domain-containing protein, partial [Phormidesmis sp.]